MYKKKIEIGHIECNIFAFEFYAIYDRTLMKWQCDDVNRNGQPTSQPLPLPRKLPNKIVNEQMKSDSIVTCKIYYCSVESMWQHKWGETQCERSRFVDCGKKKHSHAITWKGNNLCVWNNKFWTKLHALLLLLLLLIVVCVHSIQHPFQMGYTRIYSCALCDVVRYSIITFYLQ